MLYVKICRVLWSGDELLRNTTNAARSAVQRKQAKELAKRKHAVKMMIACVAVFVVCYAPNSLFDIFSLIV